MYSTRVILATLGLLVLLPAWVTARFARDQDLGRRRILAPKGADHWIDKRATIFAPLAYAAGQISDGVAGNAAAQAQAVCTAPFAGVNLAAVSRTDLNNLEAFREAAETAENAQFVPQLAAATGTQAAAIRVGLIKNKVLKLTCFLQVLQIKQALEGSDQSAAILDDQTKLATNVQLDVAAKGQASVGVTGASAS